MSLVHGRAVLSLAPYISSFLSPLPSRHRPANCLQKQMPYNIHCSPVGLLLDILIPILINAINLRGDERAVFKLPAIAVGLETWPMTSLLCREFHFHAEEVVPSQASHEGKKDNTKGEALGGQRL